MAKTPPFTLEAYVPPESLWRLVEENASPGELQEIKDVLGNSMVEQSLELRTEVEALLDIWCDYRQDTESIAPPVKMLPEPPLLRKSLKGQIKLLVESLKERTKGEGRDSGLSLSRESSEILDYVLLDSPRECSTPTSLKRPSTTLSIKDGRETPMRMTSSSDGDELSATSTISDRVESVKKQLTVLKIYEVIQELRSVLEDEVSELLRDIHFLQGCLEDESDYRVQSRIMVHQQEPSIQELRAEKDALEKQLEETSAMNTINLINSVKPKTSVLLSSPKKLPSPLVHTNNSSAKLRPSPPPPVNNETRREPFKVPHPAGRVRSSIGGPSVNSAICTGSGDEKELWRASSLKATTDRTGTMRKPISKLQTSPSNLSKTSPRHGPSLRPIPPRPIDPLSPAPQHPSPPAPQHPSPPSSARPPLSRPSSAQRFRTRVLESRQGSS